MTGYAVTARRIARQAAADLYHRLRTAHPVTVLEWLRNGVLLCVLAAALMYVWVATAAGNDIGGVLRTQQALMNIDNAHSAVQETNKSLRDEFNGDVTLIGIGTAYATGINQVDKDLTLAAEGNAAGPKGTLKIQNVQDQLVSYLQFSVNAVDDYGTKGPLVTAAKDYMSGSFTGINQGLEDLRQTEEKALSSQRGAWPLDPGAFWSALLGPVIGMLLLTVATAHVLARHFRRHVSPRLWGSLLITGATAITVGIFNWSDEWHLSADPWAGHPATLTIASVLFLLAGVLAYLAYRPRLAEYRFESS